MIKKLSLALIIFVSLAHILPAQNKDFIVLLDRSVYMSDQMENALDLFVRQILRDHLQLRDQFHLLSYSQTPDSEISQVIRSKEDVEIILRRMLLLNTDSATPDLLLAMNYLSQYSLSLSSAMPKTIIIISSGYHNSSLSTGTSDSSESRQLFMNSLRDMENRGWFVRVVQMPMSSADTMEYDSSFSSSINLFEPNQANDLNTENPGSSSGSEAEEMAGTLDPLQENIPVIPFSDEDNFSHQVLNRPRILLNTDLGTVGQNTRLTIQVENLTPELILLRLSEIRLSGQNILQERISMQVRPGRVQSFTAPIRFPASSDPGLNEDSIQMVFTDNHEASPRVFLLNYDLRPGFQWEWNFPLLAVIAIVLLFLLLMFLLLRKITSHGNVQNSAQTMITPASATSKDSATQQPGSRLSRNAPQASAEYKSLTGKTKSTQKQIESKASTETRSTSTVSHTTSGQAPDNTALALTVQVAPPQYSSGESRTKNSNLYAMDAWNSSGYHQSEIYLPNVRSLKKDQTYTLGGNGATFKIFFYKVTGVIAQITLNEGGLHFKPLSDEHFPGIEEINDCLGLHIPLYIPHLKEIIHISFQKFQTQPGLWKKD